MTQLPILVPAAKLIKSPSNVRKTLDAQADAQLEASIAERGILQNLIGLPIARKRGHYRITAGGRRLDRVHHLIETGVLDPNYEVPVLVVGTPGDAIEISLAENFIRLDMNPAEACRAFQDIIETENKTPADIAKRFGLTERFVLGRLRLATLAEPVFDALRAGRITLDVASAYASTADTARQAALFAQLDGGYGRDNVSEIRRQLAVGGYRGDHPKALLIGREAYLAAGGRIDQDLLTDAASETWIDGTLIDELAETALVAAAEAIRAREGFAEIRPLAAGHVPYMATHMLRPLRGTPAPLSDEEEARVAAIQDELDCLEKQALERDAYDYSEEETERFEALQSELESLRRRPPVLSHAEKAGAVAFVVIGPDGTPQVDAQLYVAPDETPAPDGEPPAHDYVTAEADGASPPSQPAMSTRLADELATMKTELLAVHVASDPHFALDLVTFFMAEAATRRYGCHDLPTELRASAPSPRVHGFESGTAAAAQWSELENKLDTNWSEHGSVAERYDAFCALDDDARAAWLGWAVARTLHAVPSGKPGCGFLDHLGRKLDIDVAAWWRPTARTYFDRVTKPVILTLFEELGGLELRQRYAQSKKHDLAASAEKLCAGDTIVEAEVKQAALAWLPEAMRFEHAVADQSADAARANMDEIETEEQPDTVEEDADGVTDPVKGDPISAAA